MQHHMAPVRFVFRTNARHPEQEGAVLCRITVDKIQKEFTTSVHCLRADWDTAAQRVRGRSQAARDFNATLTEIQNKINGIEALLKRQEAYYTADRLYRLYLDRDAKRISLLMAWAEFITTRRPLVGVTLSQAKIVADELRRKRVEEFLTVYEKVDMLPSEFTGKWADYFITWMRTERKVSQNYTAKVVQTIKQVLRWCVRHEYALADPLAGYSLKFAPPPPPIFLTAQELELLTVYPFAAEPLRRAADCFLFQCYTGLAYADILRFRRKDHLRFGRDAKLWVVMDRQKTQHTTGQTATARLRQAAVDLITKYGDQFPVPTNQVYNRYLKEIAAVLGISDRRLTTHVGRKTAGALLLADGMSIEAVSKVLGHASIVMTQRFYVSITEQIVSNEYARIYDFQEAA